MKIIVQKLPLNENKSFVSRTYTTPYFETPWHQHKEIELLLITQGQGTALIGDYIGPYQEGDIFLLGENLPHWFRKEDTFSIGSAIVIHFDLHFWGPVFFDLPETQALKQLLLKSREGIKVSSPLKEELSPLIRKIERTEGLKVMRLFLQCFELLVESSSLESLSVKNTISLSDEETKLIDLIFNHCFNNFTREISLKEVATIAHMSIPTFIRFFKKSTKKNFGYFLKEIRINHACKLLSNTSKPISTIITECGFNNHANFNKQFSELKKISPLKYRKVNEARLTIL